MSAYAPTAHLANGTVVTNPKPAPDSGSIAGYVEQARIWADFAKERSNMNPGTVYHKALESLSFSIKHQTKAFSVPSKLVGTKVHQDTIRSLDDQNPPVGLRLAMVDVGGRIDVCHEGMTLGRIQTKHFPWLQPLISCGVALYLLQVTGKRREDYTLGVNIAFSYIAASIARLQTTSSRNANSQTSEDVVLWRATDGTAQANIPHVIRHSPTGLEWGYTGSGPADLALSVLARFTDREMAEMLCHDFKREVIAKVPQYGGRISSSFVRTWLDDHRSDV